MQIILVCAVVLVQDLFAKKRISLPGSRRGSLMLQR